MENTWMDPETLHNLTGEEKLNAVWNNIKYIKLQLIEEKKIEKENEKNKKKENKRRIQIPLDYCRDINELTKDKTISYIGFYEQNINGNTYIFDIIGTIDKQFYVRVTNTTNEYVEIDFNKFKAKYCQPSLFSFFDI